jgi:peptide/nickel transport system substrate-binding protein
MVEIASVFATQAKAAGVNVTVRNDPSSLFYGDDYLQYSFSIDYWSQHTYLSQVASSGLSSSPYNETHWPPKSGEGSDFEKLYNKALGTTDENARIEILHTMQKAEYDAGGYIIPYFPSRFDGYASNVKGLVPSKLTLGLANFGHGFTSIWFA